MSPDRYQRTTWTLFTRIARAGCGAARDVLDRSGVTSARCIGLLIFVTGTGIPIAPAAAAQSAESHIEVKAVLGWTGVNDEEIAEIQHAVVGAAIRAYRTAWFAIEPEFLYLHGPSGDRDVVLQVNMVLQRPASGPAEWYAVTGIGVRHTRLTTLRATNVHWGVGAGVQLDLPGSWTASPELRLKPGFGLRATVALGFRP